MKKIKVVALIAFAVAVLGGAIPIHASPVPPGFYVLQFQCTSYEVVGTIGYEQYICLSGYWYRP